jgi:hypothetical protein
MIDANRRAGPTAKWLLGFLASAVVTACSPLSTHDWGDASSPSSVDDASSPETSTADGSAGNDAPGSSDGTDARPVANGDAEPPAEGSAPDAAIGDAAPDAGANADAAPSVDASLADASPADGSPTDAPSGTDGADGSDGSLGDGGACTSLANVGPVVTPTCATGTEPIGTGGTLADGTYVLTSQTYYQSGQGGACPQFPLAVTIAISQGSAQEVITAYAHADGGQALATATAAFTVAPQGDNGISLTTVCNTAPQGAATQSSTFTAAGNTLTLFSPDSTNGLGNVGVFTKQ